ncbi:hypothetical protein [Mesonia sp. K7]|uniref:hypothetical protein n=1 Tax=Mesonia sp. K7 TaxID=2218606 RepID=UPI000DAA1B8B|nr:hypothetical protein [Mesonia sp. K7]PZD79113.1 hypothetical protein DNG35_03650 [Mesonia sp. K7]
MLNSKICSLAEQALVSLLNFGSIFLISKYVSVELFAEYTLAYSYVIFLFFLTNALLASPVLIFYVKNWFDKGKEYLLSNIFLGIVIILAVCGVLFIFLRSQVTEVSFISFFLFCFGMYLYDLLRKFVYVLKKGLLKTLLGLSGLLNITFFGLLYYFSSDLSITTIFNIYAVSFLGASGILFLGLINHKDIKFLTSRRTVFNLKIFQKVFKQHYVYAKWLIVGGLIFWGYSQGVYNAAEFLNYSSEEIAKTRVLHNFLGVFGILSVTIENHYNPIFSSQITKLSEKVKEVYKLQYKKIILLFVIATPIGLGAYHFFYFEKYGSALVLFLGMLLFQFLIILAKPMGVALKAKEKTVPFFYAHTIAFLTSIITLITFSFFNFYYGILSAMLLATIIYALVIYYFYKKNITEN